MKPISDLAQSKQKAELAQEADQIEKIEKTKMQWVPISALVIANIIFISLDVRAFDAVNKLTNSPFLAGVTVIVSGVLALYWWDILYPHARKHSNKKQETISLWGVALGVSLSVSLAFVDYIVGSISIPESLLCGSLYSRSGSNDRPLVAN
jgi:hypothetical protein